jgi:LacI family transcriptional regulator
MSTSLDARVRPGQRGKPVKNPSSYATLEPVAHPYRVRDIAVQSGLSESTVERVLNDRGNVRASTAAEVRQAIAELDRQRTQLRLAGRTFVVDVVVEAPERFSTAVRTALEAELPTLRPGVIRCRFHLLPGTDQAAVISVLERIASRGSQGVILKAPDTPAVNAAAVRLQRRQIPVVTLVTDLAQQSRIGYVGVDNRAAGATAAYLIDRWLADRPGAVLITRGRSAFRGEQDRDEGFRQTLSPSRRCREVIEDDHRDLADAVRQALHDEPGIAAVYSMYSFEGGNATLLDALGEHPSMIVAHDLDADNRELLREQRLTIVLDHNLPADLRRACQMIMHVHLDLPTSTLDRPSPVAVITPFNLPD